MPNKIVLLKFTSPLASSNDSLTAIRELIFIDEAKGDRAIDKVQKRVEKMYKEKLFVKGQYALSQVETIWVDK